MMNGSEGMLGMSRCLEAPRRERFLIARLIYGERKNQWSRWAFRFSRERGVSPGLGIDGIDFLPPRAAFSVV